MNKNEGNAANSSNEVFWYLHSKGFIYNETAFLDRLISNVEGLEIDKKTGKLMLYEHEFEFLSVMKVW